MMLKLGGRKKFQGNIQGTFHLHLLYLEPKMCNLNQKKIMHKPLAAFMREIQILSNLNHIYRLCCTFTKINVSL